VNKGAKKEKSVFAVRICLSCTDLSMRGRMQMRCEAVTSQHSRQQTRWRPKQCAEEPRHIARSFVRSNHAEGCRRFIRPSVTTGLLNNGARHFGKRR
jgi:hypothetical protein